MPLQRRQRGLQLCERRLLRVHVAFGDRAQLEFSPQHRQGLAFQRDDPLGRGDLRAQSGFLDRGGDDIRRQREVGGIELVAAGLGLRRQRFHLAAVGAEYVGDVAHGDLRREQIVERRPGGQVRRQHADGIAIAACIEPACTVGK